MDTCSELREGKRYLRVYIHIRFRHARSRAQPLAWPVTLSAAGGSELTQIPGFYSKTPDSLGDRVFNANTLRTRIYFPTVRRLSSQLNEQSYCSADSNYYCWPRHAPGQFLQLPTGIHSLLWIRYFEYTNITSVTVYRRKIITHSSVTHTSKRIFPLRGNGETVFTCLYPNTVQTRLSRDQRPTKPVSRLGTGREVGGS